MTTPDLLQALRQMVNALPTGAPVVVPREWAAQLLEAAEARPGEEEVVPLRPCPPEGWTLDEIARSLGRSRKTVWEWVDRGELRAEKFNGREYRVHESDWVAYLADRESAARKFTAPGGDPEAAAPARFSRTASRRIPADPGIRDLAAWKPKRSKKEVA